MFKPKALMWIIGLFSFIVSACVAHVTPAAVTIAASSSPQPDSPTITPIATSEPIRFAALAFDNSHLQDSLVLISTLTGKKYDAYPPIPLGPSYSYTLSANGQTLALVSQGQLYFIDLPSWKYHSYAIDLHGWLPAIVYSPDETLLALASDRPDNDVMIVDTATGEVKAKSHLGFSIRQLKFTADGKALMVYGPQLALLGVAGNAGVNVGNPKAELLSSSDLKVLWSVELSGIRQGVFPKQAGGTTTEDIYKPGAATQYEPGTAFAPNANVLYLVHGDEDKLSTVDFTNQKVTTVAIKSPTTWFERLLALTADSASAKGMDGHTKQAVISPDGQYLYVVGSSQTFTSDTNGNVNMSQSYLGLQIISTKDGSLLTHEALDADQAMLSADRKNILLTGWNDTAGGVPWIEVYDLQSNTTLKRLEHVTPLTIHRVNGQSDLISMEYFSNDTCHNATIDSITWAIQNPWDGACINWLATP